MYAATGKLIKAPGHNPILSINTKGRILVNYAAKDDRIVSDFALCGLFLFFCFNSLMNPLAKHQTSISQGRNL